MPSDPGQNPQRPDSGRPDGSGGPQPNRPRRGLMPWVILFALVALVWVVATGSNNGSTQISLDQFKTLVENKDIEPGSLITVVKTGAHGRPFELCYPGQEKEPFFSRVLAPGSVSVSDDGRLVSQSAFTPSADFAIF